MPDSSVADDFITPKADGSAAADAPGTRPSTQVAPGIDRHDVDAVNARDTRSLYESRKKIYAKRARGLFRNVKWLVMAGTLGVYYGLPWLRWDRGDHVSDQAFLVDFANQRLFLGPIEIWAQEFYYITGLLVLGSLGLFLVTSLAGRVWCGYTCPQTVWTDLMIAVERFFQGDRNARMRLDKGPWTTAKIAKKAATHATWLLIGLLTGGALIFYFRDAPTLAVELFNGTAPAIAYIFLLIFAGSTYLLGGLAREQVCIYMCPWPRIQGAMFDKDSLLVSYRPWRGEPRGPHKKGETWDGRGDCIDCKQCVVVCPMGIDIRDGPQLECIQCALCIDACNDIMTKIGRPKNLIAYDTFRKLDAAGDGETAPLKLIRPRTILYAVLIPLVFGIMFAGWINRSELEVNVLRDRNPLFVRLSDGGVRNGYTVKILNKRHETRQFVLMVEGLKDAKISIVGIDDASSAIKVVPDDLRALRVFIAAPVSTIRSLSDPATDIVFKVKDLGDGTETTRESTFRKPGK